MKETGVEVAVFIQEARERERVKEREFVLLGKPRSFAHTRFYLLLPLINSHLSLFLSSLTNSSHIWECLLTLLHSEREHHNTIIQILKSLVNDTEIKVFSLFSVQNVVYQFMLQNKGVLVVVICMHNSKKESNTETK